MKSGHERGDASLRQGYISIFYQSLDRLMPMYLRLSQEGLIEGYGPTLGKIAAERLGQGTMSLIGQRFFNLFELRRGDCAPNMATLLARRGQRLDLALRGTGTEFRGLVMPDAEGGVLLNLSLGIGLAEAVNQHRLTNADFAPTDLSVEMLYLIEAKNAVLDELQRLNQHLQVAKRRAEQDAVTDMLTGLHNRRSLEAALSQACRGGQSFALLHLDLDQFKAVNDGFGHAAGDRVLCRVADLLRQETRPDDILTRVGGDEFVLLLPRLTDRSKLSALAGRLIAAISQPISLDHAQCQIGASIGLACSNHYASPDPVRLLAAADWALYQAKARGRGQFVQFQPEENPSGLRRVTMG